MNEMQAENNSANDRIFSITKKLKADKNISLDDLIFLSNDNK